jgi:hypothetical protein
VFRLTLLNDEPGTQTKCMFTRPIRAPTSID